MLQNQYHRDIDKLSRTCVYTVNRNKSLYHIHGLYVIDNMNLVKVKQLMLPGFNHKYSRPTLQSAKRPIVFSQLISDVKMLESGA